MDTSLCAGQSITLNASTPGTYQWSTGETSGSINVNKTNAYWLKVTNEGCQSADTINVFIKQPVILNLGKDSTLCPNAQIPLKSPLIGEKYKWQDGSTSSQYLITKAGLYWMEITRDGCLGRDSINVTAVENPVVNLGPDRKFCKGDTIFLDASTSAISYSWNTDEYTRRIRVWNQGTYMVTAVSKDKCYASDTVVLTHLPAPVVDLGKSGPLCFGTDKTLDAGNPGAYYLWNTGSTNRTINILQPGRYWVRVNNELGCAATDSIDVTALYPKPSNFLPADTAICIFPAYTITSKESFRQYFWNTGSTARSITVSKNGTYWLTVTDNNNCSATDSITLASANCQNTVFVPNAFTPGGNGINDSFKPTFSNRPEKYQFSIYNRFGELVFSSTNLVLAWDGIYKGVSQPAGVYTWVLKYQDVGSKPEVKKGTIMLIR
jgi:gliding motility-associated-like protein